MNKYARDMQFFIRDGTRLLYGYGRGTAYIWVKAHISGPAQPILTKSGKWHYSDILIP